MQPRPSNHASLLCTETLKICRAALSLSSYLFTRDCQRLDLWRRSSPHSEPRSSQPARIGRCTKCTLDLWARNKRCAVPAVSRVASFRKARTQFLRLKLVISLILTSTVSRSGIQPQGIANKSKLVSCVAASSPRFPPNCRTSSARQQQLAVELAIVNICG